MIVDDEDDALILSRHLVEKAAPDAIIVTARGARDAMAHLLQTSNPADVTTLMPDVLLLDLNMPGMDGLELLRWVRRNQSLATVKVVMLSSSEASADIRRATELGAHGYLIKYPNPSCLACVIKQALTGPEGCDENHVAPQLDGPSIDQFPFQINHGSQTDARTTHRSGRRSTL